MQAVGEQEPGGGAWTVSQLAFLFRLQFTHTTSTGDCSSEPCRRPFRTQWNLQSVNACYMDLRYFITEFLISENFTNTVKKIF